MRNSFVLCLIFTLLATSMSRVHAEDSAPRVLVVSDSAQAGADFVSLLQQRGAKAEFAAPDAAHLAQTDVVLLYSTETKPLAAEHKDAIDAFAKRGGGFVVIQGAIAAGDAAWWKTIAGGAWIEKSRKFNSRMMLYLSSDRHPIIKDAWSFDVDDLTIYDLDLAPDIKVMGSAFTPKVTGLREDHQKQAEARAKLDRANIYDLQPQMWAYEAQASGGLKAHRAFVALQGSSSTLAHPSYRVFALRGIAWAAGRANLDSLCTKEELGSIGYPSGGPSKPSDTVKQMEVHPDFTVSVVASEPLINKPIAVNWDAKGRLWVAETPEYPNGRRQTVAEPWKETSSLAPGQYERPALDRISILTDTDGDGVMDKKTVFYEGLELVTGFCFYKDGIIVLHEPDIVFIRDTDGDDKGDKVERLFTGFKPGDTHFVANHLIPGSDGWIYVSMGGGEEIRSADGKKSFGRVTSGMFRFKPDGSAIEQVSSKGGNGFGADVTSDGELFFGQATSGNPIQHVVLPEWTLAKGRIGTTIGAQSVIAGRKVVRRQMPDRAPLMQIDTVGGYSASCGALVYEGGAWPDEWDHTTFNTEPILNVIHSEKLKDTGPTFTGEMKRTDAEFIFSRDYWFRPVDVASGPDGAIYLVDFYTPVIAHSDSRGPQHGRAGASVRPDREHYFGRIYRVQHNQAKKLDVPDLSKASVAELAAAMKHPNRVVRGTAFRLLVEKGGDDAIAAVSPMAKSESFAPARNLALWALERLGALKPDVLSTAINDATPAIRKTAALIAESIGANSVQNELAAAMIGSDARTRLMILRALATAELKPDAAAALTALFPKLEDDWTRSAAVAAAASSSYAILAASLKMENSAGLTVFLNAVASRAAEKQDAAAFAKLVLACAAAPSTADVTKRVILDAASTLTSAPNESAELTAAIRALLGSENVDVSIAALPIAANWDKSGTLKADVTKQITALLEQVKDAKSAETRRMQIAAALIGARSASAEILPAMAKLLETPASGTLKRSVISSLGVSGDMAASGILIAAFPQLAPSEQDTAFNMVLSRPEWTNAFLDAIEARKLSLSALGPPNVFRLRTHPVKEVAARAVKLLDAFKKPNSDKDSLIAQLLPEVIKPGNSVKGREAFTKNCSVCHKFNDIGNQIGPVLTGMGVHGPDNLLVNIIDPNRVVDSGYESWNVITKDGQVQSGILAAENDASVLLKNASGQVEVPKANIKTLKKTNLSLMPEGFESLGAETLRDILSFLCDGASQYRVLDLNTAFTADSRRGLYASAEALNDTLKFAHFGLVNVDGVPFDIIDPGKSLIGGNLIVLKGGGGNDFAQKHPQKVEIKIGYAVTSLHFLGGIAGWASRGPRENGGMAMKVTMSFAGGQSESVILHDGNEFIDYVSDKEVPGSKRAIGLTQDGGHVRTFTIPVKSTGVLQKITLESPGGGPAATTVAITAELPGAGSPGALAPVPAAPAPAGPGPAAPEKKSTANASIRALIVGGGSSHDFNRWFNQADVATLSEVPGSAIDYTDKPDAILAKLSEINVLYLSNNQPLADAALRKGIFDFAEAGNGLMMVHPAVWYNWRDWPEYNRVLVGGGSRGHDKLGEFEVVLENVEHPILAGVPKTFKITDELYNVEPDKTGTPIQVLASAKSPLTGKTFPIVWIVQHPKARIVCISLGHDGRAHDLAAYKTLLANSLKWAAKK